MLPKDKMAIKAIMIQVNKEKWISFKNYCKKHRIKIKDEIDSILENYLVKLEEEE